MIYTDDKFIISKFQEYEKSFILKNKILFLKFRKINKII